MKTIAIANHKGGVGKTTTAYWLTYHLAGRGLSVLAVDMDPQGNLTDRLGGIVQHSNGTADVLMRRTNVRKAAQECAGLPGVTLLATDIKLEDTSAAMQAKSPNHIFLRRALADTVGVDVAIIDCQPSANILTINALIAADYVVIPCEPEDAAIAGANRIVEMAAWLRDEIMIGPEVLGVIATRANLNTVAHRERIEDIERVGLVIGMVSQFQGQDAELKLSRAYHAPARIIKERIEC